MEERRIHDERIIEDVEPVTTRRVVTERRLSGGGFGMGANPLALVIAAVLVVFILLLVFGAR